MKKKKKEKKRKKEKSRNYLKWNNSENLRKNKNKKGTLKQSAWTP